MIRLISILLVAGSCLGSLWLTDPGRFAEAAAALIPMGQARHVDQDQFQSQALSQVNQLRGRLGQAALAPTHDIQESLGRFIARHSGVEDISLDSLFQALQQEYPGAQFLSATLLNHSSQTGLLESLSRWQDTTNTDYETLSTFVFPNHLRTSCLAVLARRLPVFELEAANHVGGRFFNHCPVCNHTHAVELDMRSRTLILTCPDCDNPYDVLAADTEGNFQRATDFLESFSLPRSPARQTGDPYDRMCEIWVRVLGHCEYEYDSKKTDRGEAWKSPSQTWNDGAGDCEDTAILLTDALLSAGIEARVAIGWNSHIGQHAWCVARIGERQYVLESTLKLRDGFVPEPIPVPGGSGEYRPEQLFDRAHLYFREAPWDRPCDDYWTGQTWRVVVAP